MGSFKQMWIDSESSKKQTLILYMLAIIYITYCITIYNYLHSICIVLGTVSNLEMILSMWESVCSLHANTKLF